MSRASDLRVVPLTAENLDAAAGLLAERQARLRAVRPELPVSFTDPSACRPAIAAVLERPGAHGVLALRDGQPAGYLVGYPRAEPIWGRACWSPIEGSALASDLDAEHVRDLYAAWSEQFVRTGQFLQYVHAPVDDPDLMAAWVRTGFGQMQAHAVRDLELNGEPPAGVTIRRAGPDDLDLIEPLMPIIQQALMRPPAYAISLPESFATLRAEWMPELSDPEAHIWLAVEDGRARAMIVFYEAEPGPMVPDDAWELAVAMTLPEERGRGLMRALVATGFAGARQAGKRWAITDWRTASLPTHRSWTALGFRPTHYRMHRHIDERIAWAAPR